MVGTAAADECDEQQQSCSVRVAKSSGSIVHSGMSIFVVSGDGNSAWCAASRFSTRSRRLSKSGSLWKIATARNQMRLSKPGEPETTFPGGTSYETADCA